MGTNPPESDTPTIVSPAVASDSTDETLAAPGGRTGDAEPMQRGQTLGRYVVISLLGKGAMGVVYAAYDPELDRKVAVKLLQTGGAGSSQGSGGTARLLREAQAMAALSHPNVITVHDVGTIGDEVFVAMEFIDGWTLKEWVKVEKRSVEQVLGVFAAAGRGLAAAHAAGLVHRDFKPDNVMVGRDGRVRVMDFGLARKLRAESVPRDPAAAAPPAESKPLTQSLAGKMELTQTGAVLGTPAYMSPEQHMGGDADARSDQFSFCVAAYEALYGERPFAGDSAAAIAFQIYQGRIREEKHSAFVPGWARRALVRGLERDPESRYPDMHALVEALSRDPRGRLKRVAAVAAIVVAASGGAYAYATVGSVEVCAGASDKLSGVWDEARRAEIEATLLGTSRPHAVETWTRVEAGLDAYTDSWAAAHRDACEATRVHGEQSEELLDLRMMCLRERLEGLASVTTMLVADDPMLLDRAVDAVVGLPSLEACADIEALTAPIRPPADPDTREAVAKVRDRLATIRTSVSAGRYPEGLEAARAAVERARELGHAPTLADALLWLGRLETLSGEQAEAEATLLEAAETAAEGHHDRTAATAWTELVRLIGADQARPAEGLLLGRVAQAAMTRGDSGPEDEADLAAALAAVHEFQAKYDEARAELERALALRESELGRAHPVVSRTLIALGDVARQQGKYDEAQAKFETARASLESALGAGHPEVARVYNSLGNVAFRAARFEDAVAFHEKALTIREAALTEQHTDVAASLNNLGAAHEALRQFDRATQRHERALKIRREALGDKHPKVAMSLNNLGNVSQNRGDVERAIRLYEQALAIKKEALGDDHPSTAQTLGNLGNCYRALDRNAEALPYLEQVLAVFRKTLGDDHPDVAGAHVNLAQLLGQLDRHRERLEHAAAAVQIYEKGVGLDSPATAAAISQRGQAIFDLGDPHRARADFERAAAVYEKIDDRAGHADLLEILARVSWQVGERATARSQAQRAHAIRVEVGGEEQLERLEQWMRGNGML